MASSATAAQAPLAEPALLGASTLIGNDIRNPKNEGLGSIDDIMLDASSGKVRYAVLSCGGFFGIGDRQFAVPWSALKLDPANKRFVLDVDVDHLKPAPGFDKDPWPNMSDSEWSTGIHSYYGARADTSRS
jgi:sporulation protein YlmC with PRC-barrel domain